MIGLALSIGLVPTVAYSQCSIADSAGFPVEPWHEYEDLLGPYLDKVWFRYTSAGIRLCNPTEASCDYWKLHLGIDLNRKDGADFREPVLSIANGQVIKTIYGHASWGNFIVVRHRRPTGESFDSLYAHLEDIHVVEGQCVEQGWLIGSIGSTGFSTGNHLHFEIRTDITAPIPGQGYSHHYSCCVGDPGVGLLLDKYTSPESFILFYGAGPSIISVPSTGEPSGGEFLDSEHFCVDDNGTADGSDDSEPSPCFRWRKPPHSTYQEVYIDGSKAGRIYGGKAGSTVEFPIAYSFAPGNHSWHVEVFGPWVGSRSSPTWEFEVRAGSCSAVGFGASAKEPRSLCAPNSPGTQPEAVTVGAFGIYEESAELRMSVHPGGSNTDAWFWFGTGGDIDQSTPRVDVGSGDEYLDFNWTINGLSCDTSYSFRPAAQNIHGAVQGAAFAFQTAECEGNGGGGSGSVQELLYNGDFEDGPSNWVTEDDFHIGAASNSRNGAFYAFVADPSWDPGNDLVGEIYQVVVDIPDAEDVELTYYYSITTQEPTTSTAYDEMQVVVTEVGGPTDVLETFSNLDDTSGAYRRRSHDLTRYAGESIILKFLAETDGSYPTVFRLDDVSLLASGESGGPPDVSTESADQITESTARLNLSVTPNGLQTEAWFEWDDDQNLSFETDERIGVGSGTSGRDVSISLYGLDCGTGYYYQAIAGNGAGEARGSQRSFVTAPCSGGPPIADTDPAIQITETSARLTAEIFPNERSTEAWFAWGETSDLGRFTARDNVGSSSGWVDFEVVLNGLVCGQTYHFEAYAENSAGLDDGVTLSFETLACGSGGGGGGGGGGQGPTDGFLVWTERQSCHRYDPAVLVRWEPVAGATSYRVESPERGYSRTIDPSVWGLVDLVVFDDNEYDGAFDFHVVALTAQGEIMSRTTTAYIVDRVCRVGGSEQFGDPPGEFTHWIGPWRCEGGQVTTDVHWSESNWATSYDLRRIDELGGAAYEVQNLTGLTFTDSFELEGGYNHVYDLTAKHAAGSTNTFTDREVFPRSEVCGDSGLPGPFDVTASSPYCLSGEPAIPVTWTEPSGAGSSYDYVVKWQNGNVGGRGGANSASTGFAKDLTAGVRPGQINEVFMIAESANDPLKRRVSNSVFIDVPFEVCGTPSVPRVDDVPPVEVTRGRAILRGSTRPNGSEATAWFEWGTTMSYGTVTPSVEIGSSSDSLRPSADIEALDCETEYHYRLVVQNATGTTYGDDTSFITPSCDSVTHPLAVTYPAEILPNGSVKLHGKVRPNGASTVARFEWGEVLDLSTWTETTVLMEDTLEAEIENHLSGLDCEKEYLFRMFAENFAGYHFGEILTFRPECTAEIFVDDFETGDTSSWNSTSP